MSIKDEINKSFKVGNLITNNYADKAEINVKDFYDLDKINREKVLQKSKFCCILWVSHIFFTTQVYGGEQT